MRQFVLTAVKLLMFGGKTRHVWHSIRTRFFVSCPRLDATDGIFGDSSHPHHQKATIICDIFRHFRQLCLPSAVGTHLLIWSTRPGYLTIIPRARMGSESIAHSAPGLMGYWLRGQEGKKNNCFSKIQLVSRKYRDKTTLASKTRFSRHCFGFQSRRFSLQVGYNI